MATARYVGNKSSKVIGGQNTAWIIADKIVQLNKQGKIQNRRANDRLTFVVGANAFKSDSSDRSISEVNPALSAAGIVINQAVSTSYVLNPEGKKDGLVLPQPVAGKIGPKLANTEKGLSNVTIFADDHRYVAYGKGGINLHTGLVRDKKSLNAGSGVSLIHGKSAEGLESMVKGKSLRKAIHNLETVVSNINNNVFDLSLDMFTLTSIFAGHIHFVPWPTSPSIAAMVGKVYFTPKEIKRTIDNVITELNSILNSWNQGVGVEGSYLSEYHKLN